MTAWNPGVGMELVAHDGYALGRPKLDRIDVRVIPDSTTLIASLLAGAVDLAPDLRSIDGARQLRAQWQSGAVVVNARSGGWTSMSPQFVDPSPAVIGDVRFRAALVVAIDRQAIAEDITGGLSAVPASFLDPDQPQYAALEAALPSYGYDPARAGQLLADLGYARSPDGMFRDAEGQPIAVEVRGSAGDETRAAAAIADDWRRLGLAASPLPIPPQLASDRQYTATFPGFYVHQGLTDAGGLRGYTSAATPMPANGFSSSSPVNFSRYMSADLDDLVAAYFRTIPLSDRVDVMGRIVRLTSDELAIVPLYDLAVAAAHADRVSGVSPHWSSSSFGWNAYEWDVTS